MKKFLLTVSASLFLLACSDDSSSPTSSNGSDSSPNMTDFFLTYSVVDVKSETPNKGTISYDRGDCLYDATATPSFVWQEWITNSDFEIRGDTLIYRDEAFVGNSSSIYGTWTETGCYFYRDEYECESYPSYDLLKITESGIYEASILPEDFDLFYTSPIPCEVIEYTGADSKSCLDYLEKENTFASAEMTFGDVVVSRIDANTVMAKYGDLTIKETINTNLRTNKMEDVVEFSKGDKHLTCTRLSFIKDQMSKSECNDGLLSKMDQLNAERLAEGYVHYSSGNYSEFRECLLEAMNTIVAPNSSALYKHEARNSLFKKLRKK